MSGKTQGKWDEQQLKYIEFLARGKKDLKGNERTEEHFAKTIGVDFSTVWRWKQKEGFAEALIDAALRNIAPALPGIANGVAGKAAGLKGYKNIDTPAATLLLKMYGLLTEKQKVEAEVENRVSGGLTLSNVSDADLEKIIQTGQVA